MDRPDPRDVVRTAFAAVAARDADALAALLEEDCEFHTRGTSALVDRVGPYVGREGAREYVADVDAAWVSFAVRPAELRVVRQGVVAFGEVEGETSGGTPVRQPVIWVFKLRGARLRSVRVTETAAQAERLAADPAA